MNIKNLEIISYVKHTTHIKTFGIHTTMAVIQTTEMSADRVPSTRKLSVYRGNIGGNSGTSVCVLSRRLRDVINYNDVLPVRAGPESRYPGASPE